MSLLANAGTPLMWITAGHLLIGNLFIGLFEGCFLAKCFGFRPRHSIVCMIIANYISFVAGMSLIEFVRHEYFAAITDPPPIFRLRGEQLMLAVLTYFATIVVEWPMVMFAARGSKGSRWKNAAVASLATQTVSYLCLVPVYAICTTTSLITVPHLQGDLAFVKAPSLRVYFIEPTDGSVVRMQLSGKDRETVARPALMNPIARLFVSKGDSPGRLKLLTVSGEKGQKPAEILADVAARAAPMPNERLLEEPDTMSNFGHWGLDALPDLREDHARQFTCKTGFWAAEGLQVYESGVERYRLALETIFASPFDWAFRNAVVLPGDQVIVQVRDQLLILDMPTRKLGFLAMGRGPVVVAED